MDLETRVASLEQANRRWRVGAVIVGVGLLMGAGTPGPEVTNIRRLRATGVELWDRDRGGLLLDMETEFNFQAGVNANFLDRIEKLERGTARMKNMTGLDTIEAKEAQDAAKAIADEQIRQAQIFALQEEIRQLRQANARRENEMLRSAAESRFSSWDQEVRAAQSLSEMRKIRRALEDMKFELRIPPTSPQPFRGEDWFQDW